MKAFRSIVVLIAAAMLAGCGKSEKDTSTLNYEQPAVAMIRAVRFGDDTSYLNCYTEGAREKYIASEDYNSGLCEVLLPKSKDAGALKYNTLSAEELKKDDISKLEEQYRESYHKRIDISKAYSLDGEISTVKGGKVISEKRTITVVNTDGSWLIYGDVIESFELE